MQEIWLQTGNPVQPFNMLLAFRSITETFQRFSGKTVWFFVNVHRKNKLRGSEVFLF